MSDTVVSPRLTPSLQCRDARGLMDWLVAALGFRTAAVYEGPNGTIAHAQLVWRTGVVYVASGGTGPWAHTGPASISLAADDAAEVDALHERAVAAGAEVVQGLTDEDYGSHQFSVRYPEGNLWTVGTYRVAIPG